MKQDNIFRFVSVRPPALSRKGGGAVIIEDEIGREVEGRVASYQDEHRVTKQEARAAVGKSIIDSDGYYRSSRAQPDVSGLEPRFERLLLAARTGLAFQDFRSEAKALLLLIDPQIDPDRAVDSGTYGRFRRNVWLSYYALLLAQDARPQDFPGALNWIRLLHLIESAASDADYRTGAPVAWRARPVVPASLFVGEIEPPAEPTEEDKEKAAAAKINAIKANIERLMEARAFLQKTLSRRKEAAVERTAAVEPPEATKASATIPVGEDEKRRLREGATAIRSGIDSKARQPSWRLDRRDFKAYPEHGRTLETVGIEIDSVSIPVAVERLNREIAMRTAELSAARRKREIKIVRGVPVEVISFR